MTEQKTAESRCPALVARKNAAGKTEMKCFLGMECEWCNIPAEQAEELEKRKKMHIISTTFLPPKREK